MYKLTKRHVRYTNQSAPVLIRDADSGPYDRNCRLPFTNDSIASAFVQRHLLGETLPTDPSLKADENASLETYAWEFLTERTAREVLDFAEMYHRLLVRGVKIPELV